MLQSGFLLEDPHQLALPLEKLVKIALGYDKDVLAEKIEFSMSEDDPDSDDEEDKKEDDEEVGEPPEGDLEEEEESPEEEVEVEEE